MDDMSLDIAENFGLGPIHDDSFGGRKIVCTPLNKLRAMGGLVNREKMEKIFKNTTGIATLVLKDFQFTPSSFNGFPHQNGIKNLGVSSTRLSSALRHVTSGSALSLTSTTFISPTFSIFK